MIEIGKWRKDREDSRSDRWLLPMYKISGHEALRAIDYEIDAYGKISIGGANREISWFERHTKVDNNPEIDKPRLVKWIFEERR